MYKDIQSDAIDSPLYRWLMLFVLFLPFTIEAEPLDYAMPASVGMSAERLASIGPVMQSYIDRGEVAGTVTMVMREGKIVYEDARGYADLASGRRLKSDDLFRLASQTKPVTAVAVMILMEQGKLRIDDPIERYLPSFKTLKVARLTDTGEVSLVKPATRLTIRHLLTHTGGMSTGDIPEVRRKINQLIQKVDWQSATNLEESVEQYTKLALGFEPGTRWEYSPVAGFNVLARVVEVVSGQDFWTFSRENIFGPLKMNDTFYYVPPNKLVRFTAAYLRQKDGSIVPFDPAGTGSRFVGEGKLFAGAGGLVSTVYDYARFAQMLLNGGEFDGVRILSPKSVAFMTTPHATGIPKVHKLSPNGSAFGLGVNVVTDLSGWGEAGSIGTYMWGGAFGTTFWIDPEEQLIGFYMMQLSRHQKLRIRGDFRALVYGAIVE